MDFTAVAQIRSPRFAGHETFTLRYAWLKKAVDAVSEDPQVFTRDDALVTLGVGKNMVRSIRHWAMMTGIVEEEPEHPDNRWLRPSVIGESIFSDGGYDPYLEDTGTLWLLHYLLVATSNGPTTWYWTFNHFSEVEFTTDRLVDVLSTLAEREQWTRVAKTSLRRDVNCFIRTYVPSRASKRIGIEDSLDCPLTELDLIHEVEQERSFAFSRGAHPSLPAEVFVYALVRFWDSYAPDRNALLFDELAYQPGSPGRVFKLSEGAITDYLDSLSTLTGNEMSYDVTAGLMQVYRRGTLAADDLLKSYYSRYRRRRR
jgi:hypothetical protein